MIYLFRSISSIATSVDSTSQRHGSGPGLPVFVPSPAPPGPSRVPERRGRLASALILDPTTVLTSDTAVKNCRAIAVGSPGVDGRVFATNSTTGLAMVKTNGLDVRPFGLISEKRIDQPLVIVTQAWSGSVPTGVFSEATLLGPKNLTAPLQPGGTGGALFDAKGELVGMVVDDPSGRKIVAGIVPAARYQFAVAEDIAAFLQEHSVPVPKLNQPFSDKNIAGARRNAVVSLVCDPL